jgi:hypothetical protein
MKTPETNPVKNGKHLEYFKDGRISCEGNFKNGLREGEWKYFLADGKLKATGKYSKGKMEGEWKWFRKNGILMQTGSFTADQKSGTWIRYTENGKLLDVTEFTNGEKVKGMENKKQRVCKKGHRYFKTTDCPACPVCEKERKPETGFLSELSAPARRALENKKILTLKQLSLFSEKEISELHGMGPSTLPKLKLALKKGNLGFRK